MTISEIEPYINGIDITTMKQHFRLNDEKYKDVMALSIAENLSHQWTILDNTHIYKLYEGFDVSLPGQAFSDVSARTGADFPSGLVGHQQLNVASASTFETGVYRRCYSWQLLCKPNYSSNFEKTRYIPDFAQGDELRGYWTKGHGLDFAEYSYIESPHPETVISWSGDTSFNTKNFYFDLLAFHEMKQTHKASGGRETTYNLDFILHDMSDYIQFPAGLPRTAMGNSVGCAINPGSFLHPNPMQAYNCMMDTELPVIVAVTTLTEKNLDALLRYTLFGYANGDVIFSVDKGASRMAGGPVVSSNNEIELFYDEGQVSLSEPFTMQASAPPPYYSSRLDISEMYFELDDDGAIINGSIVAHENANPSYIGLPVIGISGSLNLITGRLHLEVIQDPPWDGMLGIDIYANLLNDN